MPLLIVCGRPLSGKTAVCKAIQAHLETGCCLECENSQEPACKATSVTLVNDESLGINKFTGYKDAPSEKKSRGSLLSGVDRSLTPSPKAVVIAEGFNHIKGFRYQLHCSARTAKTNHACLYIISLDDDKEEANQDVYPSQVISDIRSRFEEPDASDRWDAPLFTLLSTDSPAAFCRLFREITASLLGTEKKSSPAASKDNIMFAVARPNYSVPVQISEYESLTQHVVDQIIKQLQAATPAAIVNITLENEGTAVSMELGKEAQQALQLGRGRSVLQGLRQQFVKRMRTHPVSPKSSVIPAFIKFIQAGL